MKDFFFELFLIDIRMWILRYFLLLALPVVLTWIIHIPLVRLENKELPIVYNRRLALNKSIVGVIVLFNFYWYFLLQHNNLDVFNFSVFPWSIYNVYFALLPMISFYALMLIWHNFNTRKLINLI